MKAAIIFSIPVNTTKRFAWRWRSEDDAMDSERAFGFYAECAADAERKGFKVKIGRMEARSELSSAVFVENA